MKHKESIQFEAVKAILNGELLLEQAMHKYAVKDKRTLRSWLRKYSPIIRASQETAADKPASDRHNSPDKAAPSNAHFFDEVSLLKKIVSLQDKVQQLERLNAHLLQQWAQLLEKIDITELQSSTR